jgi:hypothetical protein
MCPANEATAAVIDFGLIIRRADETDTSTPSDG